MKSVNSVIGIEIFLNRDLIKVYLWLDLFEEQFKYKSVVNVVFTWITADLGVRLLYDVQYIF